MKRTIERKIVKVSFSSEWGDALCRLQLLLTTYLLKSYIRTELWQESTYFYNSIFVVVIFSGYMVCRLYHGWIVNEINTVPWQRSYLFLCVFRTLTRRWYNAILSFWHRNSSKQRRL